MSEKNTTVPASDSQIVAFPPHMRALSGIRFFAIFHIFLFHLWTIHSIPFPEPLNLLLIDFVRLPDTVTGYISNGWMSTSFFFLLSGFMLAYLYWGEDGKITTKPRRFLFLRLSRIYPIHILVMVVLLVMGIKGMIWFDNRSFWDLVSSFLSTLTLTQAWYPPYVPVWSWPSWNLSAIVFLYCISPWLMLVLGKLSLKKMKLLLAALPFISLIPTLIYIVIRQMGHDQGTNGSIFIGSLPLFWVAHFVAGMLLTKVFSISRFIPSSVNPKHSWISLGDVCLLAVIILACSNIASSFDLRNFFRHGAMMPLYLIIILDLARGKGLASRIFSLPGMGFIGETGFSIFIWQAVIMQLCFAMLHANPALALHQLWMIIGGTVVIAIISTYCFEKPVQKFLRRKYIK